MFSELARMFGIGSSCASYAAAIMLALDSHFMNNNIFAVLLPMITATVGYGNPLPFVRTAGGHPKQVCFE